MDRRVKNLLTAALCGAVIGALFTRFSFHDSVASLIARVPWLAKDKAFEGHWPLYFCSIAGWAVFSLYWEAAAKNAAPAQRSESPWSRALHVFLVNIALIFIFIPMTGLGRYVPASSNIMIAGICVQTIGLFLAVWARRHLGRNWSGAIVIKVEHQLIRSGPYRFLRHPIYTGLLAMYAGPALVTGEWLALIGFAMAALAYWRKIRLEEAALETAFGPEYAAYRQDTWALVPGLF